MDNSSITDHIRVTFVFLLFFSGLLGCAYPGLVTIFLQIGFPVQANGSLLISEKHIQGSWLLGQSFTQPEYFWGRPSALPIPYDAHSSGGSNLSVASTNQLKQVEKRIQKLHQYPTDPLQAVPIDLVTASASGLDPHISIAAARYQIPRIAKARGINEKRLYDLVNAECPHYVIGLFVAPQVNVLKLNLALNKVSQIPHGETKT